jgi:hypothetical protein
MSKILTGHELRKLKPFLREDTLAQRGYIDVRNTLHQLCEQGIIDRVGDGCYHNVLSGAYALFDAIRSVVRVPLYGHVSCLHDYGIITQIPQSVHIYVIDQPNALALDGVEMIHKSREWLDDMLQRGGVLKVRGEKSWRSPYPIACLHPQFVYEDMVKSHDMAGLDPDDFDWDFTDEDDFATVLPLPKPVSTFDPQSS